MKYIFQSKAEQYNKVVEEHQRLEKIGKDLEELSKEQKETKKTRIESLENLALESGYKKVTDSFYFQAFSKMDFKDYNVLISGKILEHGHDWERNEIVHVSNVPEKHLKKIVKAQIMELEGRDITGVDVGLAFGAYLLPISVLMSSEYFKALPTFVKSSIEHPAMPICVLGVSVGLAFAAFFGNSYLRKRKFTKLLKQYKDKGLITHGEKALERLISN